MNKPKCTVGGLIRPGAMCGAVIVGGVYCGSKNPCEFKAVACTYCEGSGEDPENFRLAVALPCPSCTTPSNFKLGWNGALKQAMDYAQPAAQQPAEPWPVRGVRVEGDKVIIAVKGGNDAARWLCGEVLAKHTAQPDPEPAEPMCFLQDTRSYVGNCPMWWQAGGGYTSRIDRAERFTIERALSQCRTRDTDRAWLCSDIEPLARPTIDHQEMRDIKPVPVAEHKKPDDTEGGEA